VTHAYRAAIKTSLCIAMPKIRRESSAEPEPTASSSRLIINPIRSMPPPALITCALASQQLHFVSGQIRGADYKVEKLCRRGRVKKNAIQIFKTFRRHAPPITRFYIKILKLEILNLVLLKNISFMNGIVNNNLVKCLLAKIFEASL
jgi:hypothetical protein